jgi:hypothetical protein
VRLVARLRETLTPLSERAQATSSEFGARLRVDAGRIAAAAAAATSEARWRVGQMSAEAGARLRALRAEHHRGAGIAGVALLVCLGAGGVIAAVAAAGGNADVVAVNYTSRYVTVTGSNYLTVTTPTGVETRATTVTERGKRVVRTRVVRRPEGLVTLREEVNVAGPVQQVPGPTKTVTGPTKTVTVTGPGETVTQIVTEVVTVTVTTTVEDDKGG